MNRLSTVIALCVVVSACGGRSGVNEGPPNLLAAVKQRHTLIVSTDANYAPQSYLKADGTWVGFDVDVAREVAKRLQVSAQFEDSNFDIVTAGTWHGQWDVNIDSMAVTTERKKSLLFTAPYYFVPAAFVVRNDSAVLRIGQLGGARIGVGSATTYLAYLKSQLPGDIEPILVPPPPRVRPIPYITDQLALQDLAIGGKRLDAVLTAMPTALSSIKGGAPLRILHQPVFFEDDAIALDKHAENEPEPLLAAIDESLSEMLRDGTLARLSKKYYGADLTHKH
ncbi:MAG TPA: transporter substrate-binding domain-containing protein [Candidatus Eremiobacteraceae bacterium]|nr:transporter substrate-binding domain-containing protein [Candidatus Eremiobacteraceae bacterium]